MHVPQEQRLASSGRKPGDRALDVDPLFDTRCARFCRSRSLVGSVEGTETPSPSAPRPPRLPGMVDGDCADPGGESTVTPESGQAIPGGDEGVEHDLFGDARIVRQSQRERVDLLAVRPE